MGMAWNIFVSSLARSRAVSGTESGPTLCQLQDETLCGLSQDRCIVSCVHSCSEGTSAVVFAINTEWLEVPLDVLSLTVSRLLSALVLSWAARFTRSLRADVLVMDPIEVYGFPISTNLYHCTISPDSVARIS
jgi:hypothetical protein